MALRKMLPQINPVSCKLSSKDMLVTKPDLAITPSQVQELTNRGISVSLPNVKQFLDGNSLETAKGWDVDPIFKRDANICTMFELERDSQGKIIRAHKVDRKKFGD